MRRFDGGLVIEIVGRVEDLADLLLQRVVIVFIAVSEREYADTGHKIKVFFALCVVKINVLSVIENDLIAVICVEQILLGLLDHRFHCHDCCSLSPIIQSALSYAVDFRALITAYPYRI